MPEFVEEATTCTAVEPPGAPESPAALAKENEMAIVSAVDDDATAPLARVVAGVVPSLIERLRSAQPRRVYRGAMALMERPLLHHALALTGGNQLQAARLLGLNRNTLRKRCLELGLAPTATRMANGRRPPVEVPSATPPR